jgi:hypothetical protein
LLACLPGCETVPIAVDCSYVYDGKQIDVSYEENETKETAVGGSLVVDASLFDDEIDGRSFSITVFAEDSAEHTGALYQMMRDELPTNEFVGDHGFTGLNTVWDSANQESLQYACFARRPSERQHKWKN